MILCRRLYGILWDFRGMDRGEVSTKGILAVTPLVGIICSDMEQAVIWISFFMGNLTNVNLPVKIFRANNTEHYYIIRGAH